MKNFLLIARGLMFLSSAAWQFAQTYELMLKLGVIA